MYCMCRIALNAEHERRNANMMQLLKSVMRSKAVATHTSTASTLLVDWTSRSIRSYTQGSSRTVITLLPALYVIVLVKYDYLVSFPVCIIVFDSYNPIISLISLVKNIFGANNFKLVLKGINKCYPRYA